jgi:hypothetical protein
MPRPASDLRRLFATTSRRGEKPGGPADKVQHFMTLLLQGKETEAQQLMDQFKFTGDTPALYYAQSAWEFNITGRNGQRLGDVGPKDLFAGAQHNLRRSIL